MALSSQSMPEAERPRLLPRCAAECAVRFNSVPGHHVFNGLARRPLRFRWFKQRIRTAPISLRTLDFSVGAVTKVFDQRR